jgi:hypothetical protein
MVVPVDNIMVAAYKRRVSRDYAGRGEADLIAVQLVLRRTERGRVNRETSSLS